MSSLNARTFWQYDLDDDLALNTEGLGARGRGGRRRNTDSNHHNLNSRTGSTEDTSLSMSTLEACSVNATVTTERCKPRADILTSRQQTPQHRKKLYRCISTDWI
ncbi:hypothetical protein DXG03_004933 [Asterophora parasitica]|uniref:Uncharacterized protein n=1 Tax=Asterophora parasitica TaxID=117018 RepID=A0A9P7KI34_9AGAR|nr:hypothetical protein DXG03_004933 [Asterophora parasitica]